MGRYESARQLATVVEGPTRLLRAKLQLPILTHPSGWWTYEGARFPLNLPSKHTSVGSKTNRQSVRGARRQIKVSHNGPLWDTDLGLVRKAP